MLDLLNLPPPPPAELRPPSRDVFVANGAMPPPPPMSLRPASTKNLLSGNAPPRDFTMPPPPPPGLTANDMVAPPPAFPAPAFSAPAFPAPAFPAPAFPGTPGTPGTPGPPPTPAGGFFPPGATTPGAPPSPGGGFFGDVPLPPPPSGPMPPKAKTPSHRTAHGQTAKRERASSVVLRAQAVMMEQLTPTSHVTNPLVARSSPRGGMPPPPPGGMPPPPKGPPPPAGQPPPPSFPKGSQPPKKQPQQVKKQQSQRVSFGSDARRNPPAALGAAPGAEEAGGQGRVSVVKQRKRSATLSAAQRSMARVRSGSVVGGMGGMGGGSPRQLGGGIPDVHTMAGGVTRSEMGLPSPRGRRRMQSVAVSPRRDGSMRGLSARGGAGGDGAEGEGSHLAPLGVPSPRAGGLARIASFRSAQRSRGPTVHVKNPALRITADDGAEAEGSHLAPLGVPSPRAAFPGAVHSADPAKNVVPPVGAVRGRGASEARKMALTEAPFVPAPKLNDRLAARAKGARRARNAQRR